MATPSKTPRQTTTGGPAAPKPGRRPAAGPRGGEPPPTTAPEQAREPWNVSAEERWQMVARAAYFRAEQRGFASGSALQDWLEAEREIDALLGP